MENKKQIILNWCIDVVVGVVVITTVHFHSRNSKLSFYRGSNSASSMSEICKEPLALAPAKYKA